MSPAPSESASQDLVKASFGDHALCFTCSWYTGRHERYKGKAVGGSWESIFSLMREKGAEEKALYASFLLFPALDVIRREGKAGGFVSLWQL